jgi:hypothetical protein
LDLAKTIAYELGSPANITSGHVLIEEAISMAKDAIQPHIESLTADGEPVPEEHEHPQAIVIDVAV